MPASFIPNLRSSALRCLAAACLFFALPLATLSAQDFSQPDTRPAPETALIQKANDALAAGDFPAALKILTDLNTQTPHNARVLYDLGLTLEALESSSNQQPAAAPALTAESCYRQAIDANPAFPAPHVALGLLLARTGHPADAHEQLTTATTLPDAEPALKARALRALARLDLGFPGQHSPQPDPAAASAELIAALKLAPEQPEDILLSAEIASASPDLPAAEAAYRRYLALPGHVNDPQATAALAHILLAEHHPADAEALLSPALARSPGDPSFTAQLAEAYLASGDDAKIAQAAPLLEKLHTARPNEANITRLLARVYLESGHPDQAEPIYAALIAAQAAHPDPTLLDSRAEALIRLRRPGEAEKLLKQAVADPSAFPSPNAFADAATHLAFAASEIDDPRTTLQALALRATVQPPSPSSLYLEATANDDLHQTAKAVDLYKKFLTAAGGTLPEQESQVRQRLTALAHTK
ncbi:MAG TPA: tetratricopeptide repeat protein [Acidobacteriaceae bacterium]